MANEDEIREVVRRVVEDLGAQAPAPATESPGGVTRRAKVALGADHGGYALKQALVAFVGELGFEAEDCGTWSREAVDYPDFAYAVAQRVASGACQWGIVVDGAGIGSSMAANKVPGVRASLCYDVSTARNAREHNHANVLTLGAGLIGENLAKQIVREWLETPWGGERHARRVEKIMAIERYDHPYDPTERSGG